MGDLAGDVLGDGIYSYALLATLPTVSRMALVTLREGLSFRLQSGSAGGHQELIRSATSESDCTNLRLAILMHLEDTSRMKP